MDAFIYMETKQIEQLVFSSSFTLQDSFTSPDPSIKAAQPVQRGNSCPGKKNLLLAIKPNLIAIKK